MDREALYLALPRPLRSLAVSLEGWRVQRSRFDANYRDLLSQYLARDRDTPERMAAFRDARVAAFARHAITHVPHYRDLAKHLGLQPEDIRGLADLQAFPVLPKAQVREEPSRFHAELPEGTPVFNAHTSGTTGAGLIFPVTLEAHREQWAVWGRYRRWHGVDEQTPCLYLGGRSLIPLRQRKAPFWVLNRPGKQLMFSAYHLNDGTAAAYLEAMVASSYPWLHGYPSMVALLAAQALRLGIALRPKVITLGAESLLPQQAALIREAFGVAPVQHYGMAEGVANISQCPEGQLHVDEDYAAVELLSDEGGTHRILGTNLSNLAFPLIRYEVGDTATLPPAGRVCTCGRPGRLVEAVDGRIEDFIVTRTGEKLGRMDHVFKDMVHVAEAQLRQSEPGRMEVWIRAGQGYGPSDEAQLRSELLKRVGDGVAFEIVYVEAIPKAARGKLRFVVSSLPTGRLG